MSRGKLQLVGVTSMLIASKYEEMYAPEIADFVFITDRAYTSLDIRKMECVILKALDFSLGRPLPLHFLRRNSKAGEVHTYLVHTGLQSVYVSLVEQCSVVCFYYIYRSMHRNILWPNTLQNLQLLTMS